MSKSENRTLSQSSMKILLWLLRRPVGIWLALLFSIFSIIPASIIIISNSEQMISLMGIAQFSQLLLPHLLPILICITAGLLAFFMKKEALVLYMIYLPIYLFYVFKAGLENPDVKLQAIIQTFLCLAIIMYLYSLKRAGRLK